MTKSAVVVLLCFTLTILCSGEPPSRNAPEEYLGCYQKDEDDQIFAHTPGDYIPSELSPISCMLACGKHWPFAGIESGSLCLCAKEKPRTYIDTKKCSSKCPGTSVWPVNWTQPTCGGLNRISVYNVRSRILGLYIQDLRSAKIYEHTTIAAKLSNGDGAEFRFMTGDGGVYTQNNPTSPNISHVYATTGSYQVTVEATNNVSGTHSAKQVLEVTDPKLVDGGLTCPYSQILGQDLECTGTFQRGSPLKALFNFGDGTTELIDTNVIYGSVGEKKNLLKLKSEAKNLQSTIIMPKAKFEYDSVVYAWEMEALVKGEIYLQIFRPKCRSNEWYCGEKQMCIAEGTSCNKHHQWHCQENEFFCFKMEQCIDLLEKEKTCSVKQMDTNAKAPMDFELVGQTSYVIDSPGHKLFELRKPVHVSQEDVIGWTSMGGEINFAEENSQYEFKYNSQNVVHLRSDSETKNWHHILSAHFINPTYFLLRHKYTSSGSYLITSNLSKSALVYIDIPIDKIEINCPSYKLSHQEFSVEIDEHAGTNITYLINFGNMVVTKTKRRLITYSYASPGIYNVIVTGNNSVSQIYDMCLIKIYDDIEELKATSNISAVAVGTESQISWCIRKGTNVSYHIDFGDGAREYISSYSAEYCYNVKHLYDREGLYIVTINATNEIGSTATITLDALVELEITTLIAHTNHDHLTENVYLWIKRPIEINVLYTRVSNIKCHYDFGDGGVGVTTQNTTVKYFYRKTGSFQTTVHCYNSISNLTAVSNGTVFVEERIRITDLNIIAYTTEFGQISRVSSTMSTGSLFICEWNLGDGTKHKVDKSTFNDVIVHSYSSIGNYEVSLTCENPDGITSATYILSVEKPISGFVIQCPTPHFVIVNNEVSFSVYTQEGSKLSYNVSFGDGENQMIVNPDLPQNFDVKHVYKSPGHYNVTIVAWNLLDRREAHCEDLIIAEFAVKNISVKTNSPLRYNPGNVLFYLHIANGKPLPTRALVDWNYGDGNFLNGVPLSLSDDYIIGTYKYHSPGLYPGSVTIHNKVSSKEFTFMIDVQKIVPLKVQVFDMKDASIQPGFGQDFVYFPLERNIYVNVTSQEKDQMYIFDFKDGNIPKSSEQNFYQYKYQQPGHYNITVTVNNKLGDFVEQKSVVIQESIQDMKFNVSSTTHFGKSVNVSMTAKRYGSDICAEFDFGDDHVYVINKNNCKHFEVNGDKNYTYFPVSNYSPINFKHFYNTSKGWHNVSVQISNEVSFYSATSKVFVNYIPCPNPIAMISGGSNRSFPKHLMRSFGFVLQSNVTLDCKKADKVTIWWKVYKFGSNTTIPFPDNYGYHKVKMPFSRNPGTLDPTVFELPENTLPYGLIRVELNVAYESDRENLDGITSKDTAWFEITPSNLKATIKGGVRRAVGYKVIVPFVASKTYDPDNIQSENGTYFVYEWYCRRLDEIFPKNFDTIDPADNTAGCFRNGKFRLTEGFSHFKHIIADGSIVSVLMNVNQSENYVMRVYAKKGKRRGIFDQELIILPGVPPSLDIQCSFNCFGKLDPSSPLKIQSLCSNCNSTTVVLYQWRMYQLIETVDKNGVKHRVEKNITDLDTRTTTSLTNANIALKENVLELGSDYILRVMAWKEGSSRERGGFSDFPFTVNKHPTGGFCEVTPREGVTLTTTFEIKCDAWYDEDTPLKYKIDADQGGIRQNMYTGYEREVRMILPIGDEKNNYEYDVVVTIEDHFAFGTSERFKVKVTEPANVDFDAVSSDLELMASKGNVQELTRMAFAAGSLMNKKDRKSKTTEEDAKQIREKMIQAMSNVKACSLSEIKQMGGVQSEMTKQTDEVSDDAQEQSGNALDAMSECMLQANGADPEMGNTAETMFLASSNVLNAGMANEKNITNTTGKSSADKAMDTMNKVGGSLMRQLVAGDKPKTMKAGNMGIEMAQVGDDADEDDTGFQFPQIQHILGNQSSIEVTGKAPSIGAMVTSMTGNPYKGAGGADDVKSDVMGLALSGPDGNPMDLFGQEMTMFVKRDLANDNPPMRYEYNADQGAMKVHRVNFTSNDSYIAIEIRPIDPDTVILVYIAHEKRPTVSNAVTNYTQITLKEAKLKKKLPDPYVWLFSTDELNGTGEYYIGIKVTPSRKDIFAKYEYNPTMEYTLRTWETICKIWDEEDKVFTTDGCRVGPKTTFNKTHCVCKIGGENQEAPYQKSMTSTTTTSTTIAAPTATAQTSRKKKVTRATFAGGFFVMPNPIDFSKAFAGFANLAENPVCFATVLSIFGVYLILLFWARREDRKDIERAGVTALTENDSFDRQFFEITVYTGFTSTAATTANVFFQLSGDEGQSEVRQLKDENRKIFQKRGQDVFLASLPDFIGDLQYLKIWHDNTGKNPSWYLSRVMVHDLNADRKYLFLNDNAIAVEEGDGSLERHLSVAGPEEIKSFNHLFFSTTQKNLTDNHIWFSVFIRPPKSRFTRVQRLSCCLTLLYCTMVTNAMFYQVGGEADPSTTLHVGPFAFSPSQIWIGLITSLIIFPVNILIVGVFRSIGAKPTKEEMAKKKAINWWWLYELFFCCPAKKKSEFIDIIHTLNEKSDAVSRLGSRCDILNDRKTLDGTDIGLKMETPAQEKEREEKKLKMKKQKKKLPYWMKYFAWTLLVLTSFTSAFFVVLYGFTFGKEKSAQWLSTLAVSFFQDVCVSQPIKIVGLALFIALIVKKPADDDEDEDGEANKKQIDEEFVGRDDNGSERKKLDKKNIIRFQPPSKEKIAALRSFRLKELKMYSLLRDIFIYLVFVIALCQVTYSHLDPQSYNVRKSMVDIFVNGDYGMSHGGKGKFPFTKISDFSDVWIWLNNTVVNGLYATRWYNSDSHEPGFVSDHYANLFGGSRIRQLRVRDDTCTVHDDFKKFVPVCHDWYSWGDEDEERYDPGWLPIKNESEHNPSLYYKSWEYQKSDELDTYPFAGSITAYRGGGYIGDMGKAPKTSHALLNHLYKNKWLDAKTRAVFLEVTVYNAQVNLFAIMNFVIEFVPTNGVELFSSIKIARLYTFGGSTESFTIACQFFVLLFFAVSIYREGKKMYREKKSYFKGFWNLLEFVIIVLVFTTFGVFFSRMMLVNRAVAKIEENPGEFVSFNKVTQWDVLFSGLTSILVLLSCIKSIRLLRYNKTISLLASTLKGCAKPLAAFSVVFTIFFIAFTTFAYLLFVPHLADYKSYLTASESVMSLLIGGFTFGEIEDAKPIFGPIWFVLIMLFGVMYIMNVFLSIIMETYAAVKDDLSMQSQEYELVDFMVSKFKHIIGKGDGGRNAIMEKFDKEERETDEPKQKQKVKFSKKMSIPNRKKYHKMIDDEIEMKFAQLDDSLNCFWVEQCGEKDFDQAIEARRHGGAAYVNPCYEYEEIHDELLMEQDLRNELSKWV